MEIENILAGQRSIKANTLRRLEAKKKLELTLKSIILNRNGNHFQALIRRKDKDKIPV